MVSEFAAQLYHKGYRGDFVLDRITPGRGMMRGSLSGCLQEFLKVYEQEQNKPRLLQLETHPPHEPDIRCLFKLAFDEVKGFQVRHLEISHTRLQRDKHYRITHNQQIPGSQAVAGLFPKPKPWDNHLKGKFRL